MMFRNGVDRDRVAERVFALGCPRCSGTTLLARHPLRSLPLALPGLWVRDYVLCWLCLKCEGRR